MVRLNLRFMIVSNDITIGVGGIGFVGAHRTGKTTTAMTAAKQMGLKFIPVPTTEVAKKMKFKFGNPCLFTSMQFQMEVLNVAMECYDKADNQYFITDRTPIDMMAYAYANVNETTLRKNSEDLEIIESLYTAYESCCARALQGYFGSLFYVQPGIPIKKDDSKGHHSPSYIKHINRIVGGLLIPVRPPIRVHVFPENLLNLKDRVRFVTERVSSDLEMEHTTQDFQRLM